MFGSIFPKSLNKDRKIIASVGEAMFDLTTLPEFNPDLRVICYGESRGCWANEVIRQMDVKDTDFGFFFFGQLELL